MILTEVYKATTATFVFFGFLFVGPERHTLLEGIDRRPVVCVHRLGADGDAQSGRRCLSHPYPPLPWPLTTQRRLPVLPYHHFSYLHGVCHWIMQLYYSGSFTLMLHNHIHNRSLLARQYAWLPPCQASSCREQWSGRPPLNPPLPTRLAVRLFALRRSFPCLHLNRVAYVLCPQGQVPA